MSPIYSCNACGGTFTSPQNGSIYFHTCPPLSPTELMAMAAADVALLPADVQAMILAAAGGPGPDALHPSPADLAQAALSRITIRRPGHVDQNVVPGQRRDAADKTPIDVVAEGAGVTKVGP